MVQNDHSPLRGYCKDKPMRCYNRLKQGQGGKNIRRGGRSFGTLINFVVPLCVSNCYHQKFLSMKLLILNGPNLQRLGRREPAIYGSETMDDIVLRLQKAYPEVEISYAQSNCEGTLIDLLYEACDGGVQGVAFNAGAYTHTSVALHDAIRGCELPVVEVHLSNVHSREAFRHKSLLAPACLGVVAGFGADSYRLAIEGLLQHLSARGNE